MLAEGAFRQTRQSDIAPPPAPCRRKQLPRDKGTGLTDIARKDNQKNSDIKPVRNFNDRDRIDEKQRQRNILSFDVGENAWTALKL